jgi:hypothetical protein
MIWLGFLLGITNVYSTTGHGVVPEKFSVRHRCGRVGLLRWRRQETSHMSGDQAEVPYKTGLHALRDGWRLIQASPLVTHEQGSEFQTDYLKYEFFFEKLVEDDS